MTAATARKYSAQPETVWFVARGAVLKGPFTTKQLEERIQKKEIAFFDYCWKHGFSEWRLISSLDDFERRDVAHKVPSYPSVDVPCAGKTEARAAPGPRLVQEPSRKFEIQLSKGKRNMMSAYEWAAALLFAVFLSYFAVDFALQEVKNGFIGKMAVWELGHAQFAGQAPKAVSPEMWAPLYSAPGFQDVVHLPHSADPSPYGSMPVKLSGHPRRISKDKIQINGWEIVSPSVLSLWEASSFGVDPVYSQRLELQGYLSPTRGGMIFVKDAGDPGLLANP